MKYKKYENRLRKYIHLCDYEIYIYISKHKMWIKKWPILLVNKNVNKTLLRIKIRNTKKTLQSVIQI